MYRFLVILTIVLAPLLKFAQCDQRTHDLNARISDYGYNVHDVYSREAETESDYDVFAREAEADSGYGIYARKVEADLDYALYAREDHVALKPLERRHTIDHESLAERTIYGNHCAYSGCRGWVVGDPDKVHLVQCDSCHKSHKYRGRRWIMVA